MVAVLAFLGKFGIAGSFSIIYIFAGELYPTVVRAVGMGMSSMVAGSGLILGPYLIQLVRLPRLYLKCRQIEWTVECTSSAGLFNNDFNH